MRGQLVRSAPFHWILVAAGLAVLLGVLAAPLGRHSGPIRYPGGAQDIVVQLTSGGGMAPRLEAIESGFPVLTLYGDGTLIYHGSDGYHQTRLDEPAIQRLLHLAVDDVDFFSLPPSLEAQVYDAPSTGVTLHADDRSGNVSANALGFAGPADESGPRARLARLVAALSALLDPQAPAYVPAAVRVYAEVGPGDPVVHPWPVSEVDLTAVLAGVTSGDGYRVTGTAAPALLRAAATPTSYSQGSQVYRVVVVPELP